MRIKVKILSNEFRVLGEHAKFMTSSIAVLQRMKPKVEMDASAVKESDKTWSCLTRLLNKDLIDELSDKHTQTHSLITSLFIHIKHVIYMSVH